MRILKAFLTAQLATVVDFVVTVLLSSVLGVYYVAATCIGAITGGITNCVMNYHWVFPGSNRGKLSIAYRYLLVWGGSIVLNTYGTYLLTEWLVRTPLAVRLLGVHADQLYILSKIIVAVCVAVLWNYQLQRLFVYKRVQP